jgi:hypothetical protein
LAGILEDLPGYFPAADSERYCRRQSGHQAPGRSELRWGPLFL